MKTEAGKIVLIDDEQIICDGCRLVLSEQGHSVEFYKKGGQGLQAIGEGEPDVVLLDMKLPDMEGMEILRRVRKEKPEVQVIVMTGYSTVQNAVQAMKLGAVDYLTKPFTDDELLLAVEKALERKRLVQENLFLRKELLDRFRFSNIVGENPRILEIFDEIKKVAPTDSTVLLCGESGTGKELFSRAIHAHSRRATKHFVAVDCSTLSPGLLESELFGHVRGAFTGAVDDKAGIFEVAHDGTLFLDDVANLDMEIQGKLLRALEAHEYKPVGAAHIKKTNLRVIAATNQDLKGLKEKGAFREDLFYRLNVFPIYLPPLRERRDDIPKLAYHFLRYFSKKTGKRIKGFSTDALEILVSHDWPGNVRELKNAVERLVIMSDRGVLESVDLLRPSHMKGFSKEHAPPATHAELKAFKRHLLEETYGRAEKAFLIQALEAAGGNITQAAERVGMQRSNFSTLMKKHHLSARAFVSGKG